MSQTVPIWVAYFQAIGPTISALTVVGFTAWIGLKQSRIANMQVVVAKEKLKHDLYDRRYSIYIAFENMIRALLGQKGLGPDLDLIITANVAAHQAQFLLDDDVKEYLFQLCVLARRITERRNPQYIAVMRGLTQDGRIKEAEQSNEDNKQILLELSNLSTKFGSFLKLKDLTEQNHG